MSPSDTAIYGHDHGHAHSPSEGSRVPGAPRLGAHWPDAAEAPTATITVIGPAGFGAYAIALLLSDEGGFRTRVLTEQGPAAARALRQAPADVVLYGLRAMCDDHALQAVEAARAAAPGTALVAVIDAPDAVLARDLVRAGAIACLTYTASPAELFDAIYHALAGEQYISPQLALALASFAEVNGPADLTIREKEVLRLISLGLTNREIGRSMHLSVRTIETHRAGLQRKLGTSRRADLVREAARLGLTR